MCRVAKHTDWLAVLHPQSHCDQVRRQLRRSFRIRGRAVVLCQFPDAPCVVQLCCTSSWPRPGVGAEHACSDLERLLVLKKGVFEFKVYSAKIATV